MYFIMLIERNGNMKIMIYAYHTSLKLIASLQTIYEIDIL